MFFDFKNPYKRFIKKICNGVIENNSLLEEKLISFLDKKFDLKNFETEAIANRPDYLAKQKEIDANEVFFVSL